MCKCLLVKFDICFFVDCCLILKLRNTFSLQQLLLEAKPIIVKNWEFEKEMQRIAFLVFSIWKFENATDLKIWKCNGLLFLSSLFSLSQFCPNHPLMQLVLKRWTLSFIILIHSASKKNNEKIKKKIKKNLPPGESGRHESPVPGSGHISSSNLPQDCSRQSNLKIH